MYNKMNRTTRSSAQASTIVSSTSSMDRHIRRSEEERKLKKVIRADRTPSPITKGSTSQQTTAQTQKTSSSQSRKDQNAYTMKLNEHLSKVDKEVQQNDPKLANMLKKMMMKKI